MATVSLPRRRRTAPALSLVLFGLAALASGRAEACSCYRGTVEEHLRFADVVFTGELTQVGWPWWSPWGWFADGYTQIAVARVDTLFKGDIGPSVEFTYGTDTAMCGIMLEEGSSGVFLLASDNGALSTNLCLFDLGMDVDAIVQVLGEGRAP